MQFEWDENKHQTNIKKHGLAFPEASTAFGDPMALDFDDPEHSEGEYRLLLFGVTATNRHVVISYTWQGDIIRLISARDMTRREKQIYQEGDD